MTDERVLRIRKYNQQIESKFGIKHCPVAFNDAEMKAMKKLKRVLYHILQHNVNEQDGQLKIPAFIINILVLDSAFDLDGDAGVLKQDAVQDTLDFLDNEDLMPEKKEEDKCLRNLEHAFLALVSHVVKLPEGRKLALGPEVIDNLELQVIPGFPLIYNNVLNSGTSSSVRGGVQAAEGADEGGIRQRRSVLHIFIPIKITKVSNVQGIVPLATRNTTSTSLAKRMRRWSINY